MHGDVETVVAARVGADALAGQVRGALVGEDELARVRGRDRDGQGRERLRRDGFGTRVGREGEDRRAGGQRRRRQPAQDVYGHGGPFRALQRMNMSAIWIPNVAPPASSSFSQPGL